MSDITQDGDIKHSNTYADEMDSLRRQLEESYNQISTLNERVRDLQRQLAERQHDFDHIAQQLLGEADRRDWCSEYETFACDVNAFTTHYKLIQRIKEFDAYFEVEVVPDIEHELDNVEGVFDVELNSAAIYNVQASIECIGDELEHQVEHLAGMFRRIDGVTSVTCRETEFAE